MDPVSISVAVGATVFVTSAEIAFAVSSWQKQSRLPRVLAQPEDGEAAIPVVAVHVRHVDMAQQCQGKRFTIHVKYGARGESLRCDAASFSPAFPELPKVSRVIHHQPAFPASAELGSTCLFLLSAPIEPLIRLTVRRAGFGGRTVAKASVPLADLNARGAAELPLLGGSAAELGRVSIACQVLAVPRQDLLDCLALAAADRQRDAYLISGTVPVAVGEPVDESSGISDSLGLPL